MNIRISEKKKILYYSTVTLYTYFLSQVFSKLFSRLCLTCVEIIETHRNKKTIVSEIFWCFLFTILQQHSFFSHDRYCFIYYTRHYLINRCMGII